MHRQPIFLLILLYYSSCRAPIKLYTSIVSFWKSLLTTRVHLILTHSMIRWVASIFMKQTFWQSWLKLVWDRGSLSLRFVSASRWFALFLLTDRRWVVKIIRRPNIIVFLVLFWVISSSDVESAAYSQKRCSLSALWVIHLTAWSNLLTRLHNDWIECDIVILHFSLWQ